MAVPPSEPTSVEAVSAALTAHGYLPEEGLATAIFLALRLRRPLLLEGEAGVGKTEVAKVLSRWTGGELIRLQCYEGIDASQAVYEWDYSRQLLHLRAAEAAGETSAGSVALEADLFSERFLVKRALLRAIDHREGPPPVLLIDEVDRSDDEFEAYLLEVLSDYQITVPELGPFNAAVPPVVVLTSNRTRDVHDALKRRCLYHWVEHPDFEREVAIIGLRTTGVSDTLARQVAAAAEALRQRGLYKPPGVAETIDWAQSLAELGRTALDEHTVAATLGVVLKYREDAERVTQGGLSQLLRDAFAAAVADRTVDEGTQRLAVAFARLLRGAGLSVPVGSVLTFADAVGHTGLHEREAVYWAGRATLVRRPEDIALYDRAFGAFWEQRRALVEGPEPEPESLTIAIDEDGSDDDEGPQEGDDATERPDIQLRFSAVETLRDKDFALYDATELAEAQAWMARLRVATAMRRSRRLVAARRARGRPDVRATVRDALRSGGEPVRRRHLEPGTRPRRLVLLVDISGSMEPYARALLRFVQAATAGGRRVEAFTLGTRLTRVTRELSVRDPDSALRQAAVSVKDWSGGTRLGDGLRAFLDRWGVRGMARGATVVVLSDGWDRGDPVELGEQMARLHRVAHRVVWVNPLKVTPGYEPLARGMAAALPYVDDFVEGHSLNALERLAAVIAT